LLPIPALDGGRILFTLPELIFRKRIPPQYENAVNTIGFLALLVLMFFVTAQDIINPINLH
jgi:regulator of sigma E protease